MISSDSRVERVMARGESLICLGTRGVNSQHSLLSRETGVRGMRMFIRPVIQIINLEIYVSRELCFLRFLSVLPSANLRFLESISSFFCHLWLTKSRDFVCLTNHVGERT
jgi:hypothetical protein